MSQSASLDLQGAINTVLRSNPTVNQRVGQRIYDRVPPNAVFPYISLGLAEELEDEADCIDGLEIFLDIDVWSQAQGRVEASNIAGTIRKTLRNAHLVLPDHKFVELHFRDMRVLRDRDLITTHIVLTWRAWVEAL